MSRPATLRTWIAFVAGAGLIAGVIVMVRADAAAGRPVFGPATIAVTGALAVLAVTIGLASLPGRRRSREAAATIGRAALPEHRRLTEAADETRGAWFHVVRPAVVLTAAAVAGLAGRALLVPDSYGRFGYYRGDAVREAMSAAAPSHQGVAICAGCHPSEAARHAKDMHGGIECESCHGPGADHLAAVSRGPLPAGEAHVFVPETRESCLWCHRRLAARPSAFPQIDPAEHYGLLGVSDAATPCMKCHDPHEPLFLDRPLREARLHPVIQQCRDCHGMPPAPDAPRPDDHPVVFECRYCHSEVAADAARRDHAAVGCRLCHQIHRESDTAVRIVMHRDPRFCLLCHGASPFRGPGSPPLVEWPAHRDRMGDGLQSVKCIDCHLDRIHLRTPDLRRAAAGGAP